MQFGSLHLVNPTDRRSNIEVYDLDIKAGLLFMGFLIYQIFMNIDLLCELKRKYNTMINKPKPILIQKDKSGGKLNKKRKAKDAA